MSKARARGRPRGSPANHHLFLEDGVWIAAVNGAAKLIDGGNVVLLAWRRKMAEKMGVA